MDQVLFKEAKTKKELAAEKMAKAEAAIKKAEKAKEPEKKDIYTDSRDQKNDCERQPTSRNCLSSAVNPSARRRRIFSCCCILPPQ